MTLAPFGWKDKPDTSTPISTANLEKMHAAAGAYIDAQITQTVGRLPEFNPRDYGAKGDKTDDHNAFQEAIQDMETSRVGGILRPSPAEPGKYYALSSNLVYDITKPIHFAGCRAASEIKLTKDLLYGQSLFEEKDEQHAASRDPHHFIGLKIVGPGEKIGYLGPNGEKVPGYAPAMAFGFECPGGAVLTGCTAELFYANYVFREFRQVLVDCIGAGGFYDLYVAPNNVHQPYIKGDIKLFRHTTNGALWARCAVHPNFVTEGSPFIFCMNANTPYEFYKEAPLGFGGAFLEDLNTMGTGSEATGNAVFFDESASEGRKPEAERPYYKEPKSVRMWSPGMTISLYPGSRIGNSQDLDLSGATAGTYTLTLPAEPGYGGGVAHPGGTTAPIAFNANNAAVDSAITAILGGGQASSSAYVYTVEGKKRIVIYGAAALLGTNKMTINTAGLTGTATLSDPKVDPLMGPMVRPTAAQIVEVLKATKGTFTLSATVEGLTETTVPIAFNATPQKFSEALVNLPILKPWGVVVGAVSVAGKYYAFFNGASLNKNVEITPHIGALEGAGAEVKVTKGPDASLDNRHAEYPIDVGLVNWDVPHGGFTWAFGTVGGIRATTINRLRLNGKAADDFINGGSPKTGEMIYLEAGKIEDAELISGGARRRWVKIKGPVAIGNFVALKNGSLEAELFPATAAEGALVNSIPGGYARAVVPEGKTRWIPVVFEVASSSGETVEALYTGTAPTTGTALRPSPTAPGKVEKAQFPADRIVGVAIGTGSAGFVKISPRGCA